VYEENLVVWKRVRIQGAGAGSTVLAGDVFGPAELAEWQDGVNLLIDAGAIDVVPGQSQMVLDQIAGAVVAVFGKDSPPSATPLPLLQRPLIDGFTIRNGTAGGGITATTRSTTTRATSAAESDSARRRSSTTPTTAGEAPRIRTRWCITTS